MRGASNGAIYRPGVVADVGRTTIRVGLTDQSGLLDQQSVREYDPQAQPTISSAIAAFGMDSGLVGLPPRAAIAVSGVPRGEVISITNSRWILSRSGLAAMFRAEPLIINDFAANAWAITSEHCMARIEPIGFLPVRPHRPGTYCIIGIGSGLGVASVSRDEHGGVNVIATEGGHCGVMDGLPDCEAVLAQLRRERAPVTAETLFSWPGLLSLYSALCRANGHDPRYASTAELVSASRQNFDPLVRDTFDLFARAFWHFAGNMVLAYGAWDGVIITGSITKLLRSFLIRPEWKRHFEVPGPYAGRLSGVPSGTASFKYAELEGAAVALLVREARTTSSVPTAAAASGERWPTLIPFRRGELPSGAMPLWLPTPPVRRPACC